MKSVLMLIGVIMGGAAVALCVRHLLKQAAEGRVGLGAVSDRWLLDQQRSDAP